MNLAFALNSYNKTKISNNNEKYDGYEAVKFALSRAIEGMEKLRKKCLPNKKRNISSRRLQAFTFTKMSRF